MALLLLMVGLAPAACGALEGEAWGDSQEAHGIFTGEMKPVYVSDVEASAPFYRDVLDFAFEGFAGEQDDPYYAEMVAATVKFGLHEPTSEGQESKVGRQRLSLLPRSGTLRLADGANPGGTLRGSGRFFAQRSPSEQQNFPRGRPVSDRHVLPGGDQGP